MAACVWEIIHDYRLKQILNARMAIRQRAHLVTSGISISTLEIRQERTSRFYLRVEWTSHSKVLTIDVAGCVSSGIVA